MDCRRASIAIICGWFAKKTRSRTIRNQRDSLVATALWAVLLNRHESGDGPQGRGYNSFWLLAQEMIRVGEDFRHAVGSQRIVVTADGSAAIDQDETRAVHGILVVVAVI